MYKSIFFYHNVMYSQSALELQKSNTDSCNISESMENLHTTPAPSPSPPDIPQLPASKAGRMCRAQCYKLEEHCFEK